MNETKSDTENASNWDHFGFNKESKCDKRALFRISLQNLDSYSYSYIVPLDDG